MKIKLDLGETEVPKSLIDKWQTHKEDYEHIEEFIRETFYDLLYECVGKIVHKDLAIFLRNYEVGIVPRWGGYCANEELAFEDSGNKYIIMAFGWNDEYARPEIHMVGYKEIS